MIIVNIKMQSKKKRTKKKSKAHTPTFFRWSSCYISDTIWFSFSQLYNIFSNITFMVKIFLWTQE